MVHGESMIGTKIISYVKKDQSQLLEEHRLMDL